MTKEEGVEGIKRHTEAILNIAKEIGVADYLSIAIVRGNINVDNNPSDRKDGLGINMYYCDEKWNIWH
jgi:hypothetical protein